MEAPGIGAGWDCAAPLGPPTPDPADAAPVRQATAQIFPLGRLDADWGGPAPAPVKVEKKGCKK